MLPVILFAVSVLFAISFGRLSRLLWEEVEPTTGTSNLARAHRVLASPSARKKTSGEPPARSVRTVMQVLVSLILLAGGLYTILSGSYDTEHDKWAYGAIGTVIGFWLG